MTSYFSMFGRSVAPDRTRFCLWGLFVIQMCPPGHLRLINHPESLLFSDMRLPLSSVFGSGSSLNADRRMDASGDEPEEAQTPTSGVTCINGTLPWSMISLFLQLPI